MKRRDFLLAGAASAALTQLPLRALAQTPEKPEELIVRAWGDNWMTALDTAVSKPFTEETGIRIRYDLGNDLEPKIWAAVAQKRQPPIHVDWDTSPSTTKSFLRGVTEDLSDLPNANLATINCKPAGLDKMPMVNLYGYVFVLGYRKSAFPDGAPKSWNVLLDPRFKGRVAAYADGSGLFFPAQVAGGGSIATITTDMQPAWDFCQKLHENQVLLGWDPDHVNWLQNGEVDLVLTIVSNVRQVAKAGVDVAWVVPEEGATYGSDCLWIPKGHPENELFWAKHYANLALSTPAQAALCQALGTTPVNVEVPFDPALKDDPAYPTTKAQFDRLFNIDLKIQAENLLGWLDKYQNIMRA